MKKQTNNTTAGQVIRNGKIIYSSIIINASPAQVWHILMNFDAYPTWNPFIKSITGEPAVGKHITAQLCPPGQKGMTFRPLVLQNNTDREFRWIGSLFVPYIFDGEHTFLLDDNGDGTTTFHHFERFRGILVPLMAKMLDVNTLQGFELMNAKLKEQAEQN